MESSRCEAGHGVWIPRRKRCPLCAGPVTHEECPDEGELLLATVLAGRPLGVVRLGAATAPALLDEALPAGTLVVAHIGVDGLINARRR